MAGRKPKATIREPKAFLDASVEKKGELIDALYRISYRMNFKRGAKIPDGMKRNDFRTYLGSPMTKDNAEQFKQFLIEQGEKDVKLDKLKLDLPSKCPSCENNGTPSMYQGKGTLRKDDKVNEINREEIRLIYNHSKTKPKTCFVATVLLDSTGVQFKLKSGLPIDSFGYRRRVGIYPL